MVRDHEETLFVFHEIAGHLFFVNKRDFLNAFLGCVEKSRIDQQ